MNNYNIYKDIAERTDGDIYIGVVGPVRTGKSTLIKRFMEKLVLPNIENQYKKERAIDELPVSGSGKTIMTTEPKFVPNEAIELTLKENVKFQVRMVDCVGYLIDGALGHEEDSIPRMVTTPWYEEEIPFEQAAEIGTRKVITDHSTIGIVVTTDGSITDIDRESYIDAEERVINELKEIEKPFVIVLNSKHPKLDSTLALKESLEAKYNVPVVVLNCLEIELEDIHDLLEKVLLEFPIKEINIELPQWVEGLPKTHWVKSSILDNVKEMVSGIQKLSEIESSINQVEEVDIIEDTVVREIKLGEGVADIKMKIQNNLLYKIINELTGYKIEGEHEILGLVTNLARSKREFDKIESALLEAKMNGYGLVPPSLEEIDLAEPEIFKQGSRFGVKLRAKAPSMHLIRADITTEVSPLIGTEKQSSDLVNHLLEDFENDPSKIWESNMFGKSLHDLVQEQLESKLNMLPDDARGKMQKTLQRIVNEGSGGLICIIV